MSTAHRRRRTKSASIEAVAGNGLLHRRALLGSGFVYAGAMSTGALGSFAAAAEPLTDAPWSSNPVRQSGLMSGHPGLRMASCVP